MSEKHRNYESLYIVKPDLNDAEVAAVAEKFKNVVIDNGGSVESAGKWDKRKLAYPVSGYKEGTYILMHFSGGSAVPAELDRLMRISDDVIRQLIILVEKPKVASEEATPKVKAAKPAPAAETVAAVEAEPVIETAPEAAPEAAAEPVAAE